MSTESDQELLRAFARTRSDAVFTQLAEKYQSLILGTAMRVTGNDTDARDVLQATLFALARQAPKLTGVSSLGGWLHTVATREAIKIIRTSTRRKARDAMAYQNQIEDLEANKVREQLVPLIDESLEDLPEKDRLVITMHFLEGISFRKISEVLGGTSAACQKRSSRALRKLSDLLNRRGMTMSAATLATACATLRSEASIPAEELKSMATEAACSAALSSASAMIFPTITMKTGIAISCVAGALLSTATKDVLKPEMAEGKQNAILSYAALADENQARRSRRELARVLPQKEKISMEEIEEMIGLLDRKRYSGSDQMRLEALMFRLPYDMLPEVSRRLSATKNKDGFMLVVSALYSRWAEFKPQEAFDHGGKMPHYHWNARGGAVMTWLELDFESAADAMIADGSVWDLHYVKDHLLSLRPEDTRDGAVQVDYLAQRWDKAEEALFPMYARRWAEYDHRSAAEWVLSHPDEKVGDRLLKELAVMVAQRKGMSSFAIRDLIRDLEIRTHAGNQAAKTWGYRMGAKSLAPDAPSEINLSQGFPEGWSLGEVRYFSEGLIANHGDKVGDLIAIAKPGEETQRVHLGIIAGAPSSNLEVALPSFDALNDGAVGTWRGGILENFLKSWLYKDEPAARAWLRERPPGAISDFLNKVATPKE